jgi:proline dehydrogenase
MESPIKEAKLEPEPEGHLDFTDTEIAFSNKSDKELKKTAWLFSLMNNPTLVKFGSILTLGAVKLKIPFAQAIIKKTVYNHFCGGENLLDCQDAIDKLYRYNALTILDYGAEGKSSEEELDAVKEEIIRAIEFAASNDSVPVVSVKVTGLGDNELLEKVQSKINLDLREKIEFDRLKDRLNQICSRAEELGVGVFIDAEESWMQITIDNLVFDLMEEFNKANPIVYNTYQLYRHDKLNQLKSDHAIAQEKNYFLGAKLVRGAYMDKERARAEEDGYPSPIQPDKKATDLDFNLAVKYCVENYKTIGSCCASHNTESNMLQAKLINELQIEKNHPHLNFSQLFGMSDFITFNLSESGYNVAKYVPYGPVKEVIPYLIRRAQENTSVTGEMGRELALVEKELRRRGLKK